MRGWLTAKHDERFEEKCHDICETYRLAPERARAGIETLSIDDLISKLKAFIDYFNRTMAKPFRWTYQAKPLAA